MAEERSGGIVGRFLGALNCTMRKLLFRVISSCPVPLHIVFILDGNRRFANKWKLEEGAGLIYHIITFEILVRVLMSVEPGEDKEFLKREFMEVVKGLICLPIKLPGFRMYKSLQAKERMLNMVWKIVDDRKTASEKHKTKGSPNDAIDVLLHDTSESVGTQQRLLLDFIIGNIIEMMISGEDSVPMIMTLAVKYLSDDLEENVELKKRKAESHEGYAWTDYVSLSFTQGVISETLRMANIINAVWRKALDDVEIKGYLIPKGWCILASLTSVHMDEENYENSDKYDPWRWEKTGTNVNTTKFTPPGCFMSLAALCCCCLLEACF